MHVSLFFSLRLASLAEGCVRSSERTFRRTKWAIQVHTPVNNKYILFFFRMNQNNYFITLKISPPHHQAERKTTTQESNVVICTGVVQYKNLRLKNWQTVIMRVIKIATCYRTITIHILKLHKHIRSAIVSWKAQNCGVRHVGLRRLEQTRHINVMYNQTNTSYDKRIREMICYNVIDAINGIAGRQDCLIIKAFVVLNHH